jgi:hypothetical protein
LNEIKTLRGAEIAWFHPPQIHHEFLKDDAWINHPDFQRVRAWFCQREPGMGMARVVLDGSLPIAIAVLRAVCGGNQGDNLWRLIIKLNSETEAASGDEVQGRPGDCHDLHPASVK